jgi:CRISPR-associated protein Cas2
MSSELAFVIGYDISNPRRLLRVHREMCKHATPLEYSIFLLVGSEAAKDRCLEEIDALIKPLEDDVRCYALPARGFQGRVGRASLPAGNRLDGAAGGDCVRRPAPEPGKWRRSLRCRHPAPRRERCTAYWRSSCAKWIGDLGASRAYHRKKCGRFARPGFTPPSPTPCGGRAESGRAKTIR